MRITSPVNMSLADWADQVSFDLDMYGNFGKLEDVGNWQSWASQFLNNSTLGNSLPNPYYFNDWREWAERLYQAL